MGGQTVTAITVSTTTDDDGDSTTTQTERRVPNVLFEPEQSTPTRDPRSPGSATRRPEVVTPAKFYLLVPLQMDHDDVVIDAYETWWQVIGGSMVWGDRTEVPVKRWT